MPKIFRIALLVFVVCCFGAAQGAGKKDAEPSAPKAVKAHGKPPAHHRGKTRVAVKHPADHSGKTQTGKASIYSHRLAGKKMANGERMDPNSNNAASKTLPLGTRARVTNISNGKSAVVVIKDRGPHVKGRIIDLSPATAKTIGAGKQGVIPVKVTPIAAPQSGAQGKPGTAAAATRRAEARKRR